MAGIEWKGSQFLGAKVPLFTDEELQMARKRKVKRKAKPEVLQLSYLEESLKKGVSFGFAKTLDPEAGLARLHESANKKFGGYYEDLLSEEVKLKRDALRNIIGLPVARGRNAHVNDPVYKFLVKHVCTFDEFGIFGEYDRVIGSTPSELESRITLVGQFIGELLEGDLGRIQKFRRFHTFASEYQRKWGPRD